MWNLSSFDKRADAKFPITYDRGGGGGGNGATQNKAGGVGKNGAS